MKKKILSFIFAMFFSCGVYAQDGLDIANKGNNIVEVKKYYNSDPENYWIKTVSISVAVADFQAKINSLNSLKDAYSLEIDKLNLAITECNSYIVEE